MIHTYSANSDYTKGELLMDQGLYLKIVNNLKIVNIMLTQLVPQFLWQVYINRREIDQYIK